jgi:hypothetical protein
MTVMSVTFKLRQYLLVPAVSGAAQNRREGAGQRVIQEAWIGGVPTRRVGEPAQAMGLGGLSKSQVVVHVLSARRNKSSGG